MIRKHFIGLRQLSAFGMLVLVWVTSALSAQERYVSDELVITFRTGPSSDNAIIRNLTSGQRVEVLEQRPEDGYSRVRLADGETGWVLSRYLQDEPTAEIRLAATAAELAAARADVAELSDRVVRLETELAVAQRSLDESRSSGETIAAELSDIREVSANALQMRQDNEALRGRVTGLSGQLEQANAEAERLRRRERQNWFLIGSAVLLAGVVVGLVAPSLRPKRRSSW